ncbi:MAG TPA: HEAT repeat domain-containing protein [Bacteroidota bacterium]
MKHVQDRLPEYLVDGLQRMERAEVEAHLQECAVCREEYDALLKLWAKLGSLPEEKPSPNVRTRFYAILEAYEEGLRKAPAPASRILAGANDLIDRFWPRQPAVQFGLTLVFAILGIVAGRQVVSSTPQQEELTQLRTEVRQISQLLTLSLLNQQSASERLRGVASTYAMDKPDEQVVSALVSALKYDPNVNVRLAAVDALSASVGNPAVRSEILRTLPGEPSPLVQIALVDVLVQGRVKQSAAVLEKMSQDPSVNEMVKKRIETGLKDLELQERS